VIIATEILGFLALTASIIGFQSKDPKLTLWIMAMACGLWIGHFALLNQIPGMVVMISCCVRNIIGASIDKKYITCLVPLSILPATVIALLTISTPIEILSIVALICISGGVIMRDKPFNFRLWNLTGETAWIAYAIAVGSLPLILTSIFIIGSVLISMLRHDMDKVRKLVPAPVVAR